MPVEMTQTEYILLERGDTFVTTLKFTDKKTNEDINITNYVVRFTAKISIDDSDDDAVIKKDITVHSNPTQGETILTLESADTDLDGKFLYDIQIQDTSVTPNKVDTILKGIVEFSKDVTRRTT